MCLLVNKVCFLFVTGCLVILFLDVKLNIIITLSTFLIYEFCAHFKNTRKLR